jgi:hypothetical protein
MEKFSSFYMIAMYVRYCHVKKLYYYIVKHRVMARYIQLLKILYPEKCEHKQMCENSEI